MIEKHHFHSFDALRFFSFLIVFLSHLPYSLFQSCHFLYLKGTIGVSFFFVLSGFLISYILLFEKNTNNSISLKNFFARRILRIWPLYYCVILFAISSSSIISFLGLGSSNNGYEPNWIYTLLFLENYQNIYFNDVGNVSPMPVIWSLCIEEHFYILWGLTVFFIKKNHVPVAIGIFILTSFITRYFFYINQLQFKDLLTNFDYFMYGAIPAYLLITNKEKTINFINKIPLFFKIIVLVTTIASVFATNYITYHFKELIEPLVFGILFSSTLFIFIPQNSQLKISSKSPFTIWGKYTYSLYLIHTIIINLLIQVFLRFDIDFKKNTPVFILLALGMTISASYFSYRIIETPFLRLKKYFQ